MRLTKTSIAASLWGNVAFAKYFEEIANCRESDFGDSELAADLPDERDGILVFARTANLIWFFRSAFIRLTPWLLSSTKSDHTASRSSFNATKSSRS